MRFGVPPRLAGEPGTFVGATRRRAGLRPSSRASRRSRSGSSLAPSCSVCAAWPIALPVLRGAGVRKAVSAAPWQTLMDRFAGRIGSSPRSTAAAPRWRTVRWRRSWDQKCDRWQNTRRDTGNLGASCCDDLIGVYERSSRCGMGSRTGLPARRNPVLYAAASGATTSAATRRSKRGRSFR